VNAVTILVDLLLYKTAVCRNDGVIIVPRRSFTVYSTPYINRLLNIRHVACLLGGTAALARCGLLLQTA